MPETTCANPLLLEWVKEWWDKARQQNSKGVTTYKHAYDSLKACPISFQHPSELQQLKGFGPKLCERLTEKLRNHCEENGLPMPAYPRNRKRASKSNTQQHDHEDGVPARPAKKARNAKPYVPAYRSGAYALILALSNLDGNRVGLPKAELIEAAQPHCDSSFTAPSDPTKFNTAWASMKTLEQKELVYQRGRPLKRYALTDEGWEVARRIRETLLAKTGDAGSSATPTAGPAGHNRTAALPGNISLPGAASTIVLDDEDDGVGPHQPRKSAFEDVVADGNAVSDASELPSFVPIKLTPGSFTVELVLDNREVRAKTDRDYMQQELAKRGVAPTVRALELGDALWVARCKQPGWLTGQGAEDDEVVLDWIVERKRLDDLCGSIRDGRFHEQKFRLRRSGVKNVIYLVEEISMDATYFQKYEESVQSAIASMQVVNGYFVKRTQKMDDTISYLTSMTNMLKKVYESKTLDVIPTKVLTAKNYLPLIKHLRETQPSSSHHISYAAFASLASKSELITLRDVFLKFLMATKGITGEKAIEIQKVWKTPNEFVKAFERCGLGEEGRRRKIDLVVSRLGHLLGRKKISKAVSQKLAEVWGDA
ncbi:Crossover junction endonuclease mus81 [Madurella fahalii]|uniref:Crossover junction endonuclease MUS81 n=1 Tax=Madurella fahalii TaxID=1157608 RepID=A0ABQ0FZG2_9PEZI